MSQLFNKLSCMATKKNIHTKEPTTNTSNTIFYFVVVFTFTTERMILSDVCILITNSFLFFLGQVNNVRHFTNHIIFVNIRCKSMY